MKSDVLDTMDQFGPEKVICVSDPKTGMKGVLVVDNTARGMGKGGCRMSPHVTVGEVCSLARIMTWKWSLSDLFFGGAKAGIKADPRASNKEEILRSFIRALREHIPNNYVFGLDMGLDEGDAAIVIDEAGDRTASVGTPAELGGVPYDQLGATGYSTVESCRLAVEYQGGSLKDKRVVIQGFGAVGLAAARFLKEEGATIIAISRSTGVLSDEQGLDIEELLELEQKHGKEALEEYAAGSLEPLGSELTMDTDLLVLAAAEDAITEKNVEEVKAPLILEGSNMPITEEAEARLFAQGKIILPDFLVNAGGIIAASIAMEARDSSIPPEPEEVYSLIDKKMATNVPLVMDRAEREERLHREVAMEIARERVQKAMDLRAGRR